MDEEEKKDVTKEILKSFHNQFSENQNHQQRIFLQFFSAILVSAIPFGVVFVNITDEAKFWDVARDDEGKIISYAISHLIGSWLLIQIALITLSAFTLKIAYSFRRDQKVVENIRKTALGTPLYQEIFGKKSFSAEHKEHMGGKSYVPLFCAIFWQFSIFLQFVSSFILFFRTLRISLEHLGWVLSAIAVTAIISILISYFWRYYYYLKYKITVDGANADDLKEKHKINSIFYRFLDI
ncbi:MAG: hypothetical protein HY841_05370 [Bacteroidetes bacterium]|nr:hypothetical protein [Bacteroidota bacterium]